MCWSSSQCEPQGCGFDLVSNDLMWCLYGFIKNLPETGEMIHGFVEYSLVSYWDELKKVRILFRKKDDSYFDITGVESLWGQLQRL